MSTSSRHGSENEMAKKGLYIGTGMGLILFVLVGLLPGIFIGGMGGLKIGEILFGAVSAGAIMPRLIVAFSMILGLLMSAVVFIVGSGVLGWTVGFIADAVKTGKVTVTETAEKNA